MQKVFDEIVAQGTVPKRGDIGKLLALTGEPGDKQDEKKKIIEDLFARMGSGVNLQGHKVSDDLESYEEF